MSEPDFINFRLDANEELFQRVQDILLDIRANSPSAIQNAIWSGRNATDPITDSTRLLYYYHRQWRPNRKLGFFYAGCISNPLLALIRNKADVDDAAIESFVCRTALEIVNEFMTCLWHHHEAQKQKLVQRRIVDGNRAKFFRALVLRDGKHCADCESKRKELVIDHINPVSRGGLTELINLQLLCNGCNRKKGNKVVDRSSRAIQFGPDRVVV